MLALSMKEIVSSVQGCVKIIIISTYHARSFVLIVVICSSG